MCSGGIADIMQSQYLLPALRIHIMDGTLISRYGSGAVIFCSPRCIQVNSPHVTMMRIRA